MKAAAAAPGVANAPTAEAAAVAAAAASSGVRFVAVPGSGMEDAFPRPETRSTLGGAAFTPKGGCPKTFVSAATDASLSTESPSMSAITAADFGGVRSKTASTSTQAPELKLSDWVSARSR